MYNYVCIGTNSDYDNGAAQQSEMGTYVGIGQSLSLSADY